MNIKFYGNKKEEAGNAPVRIENGIRKMTIKPQIPSDIVTRKNDNGVEVVRGDLIVFEKQNGIENFINENNDCYIEIVDESLVDPPTN